MGPQTRRASAQPLSLKALRAILALLAAATLVLVGVAAYVLPASPDKAFYDGCRKVWAHRALAGGATENSLEGFVRAFELGAPGVEIDVVYDTVADALVVISEEALSAGVPPSTALVKFLERLPPNKFLWLDFWNLSTLATADALEASERLRSELNSTGVGERVIIESVDSERLGMLAEQGMSTSLWIRPSGRRALTRLFSVIDEAKRYRTAGFTAVSLDYAQYGSAVRLIFARVPIHLFTVNDRVVQDRLIRDSKVRVILSDVDAYDDASCNP